MEFLLLDIPVSVASKTEQPISKAPGIVSVISREEIEDSGARDLNDLFLMVPGFMPATDVYSTQGFGVRGLWSFEGKMLVMVDGVPMNDLNYGNPVFSGQFTTDNIERIEIIRGPGSVLYGGSAELAVINIITLGPDAKGVDVSGTYGQMGSTSGRRIGSLHYGGRVDGVGLSFNGTWGDGHLSDGNFTTRSDQTFALKDASYHTFWSANLGLQGQDFSVRFLADSLSQDFPANGLWNDDTGMHDPGPQQPLTTSFQSYNLDAWYKLHLLDALTLTPRLTYTRSDPWRDDSDWAIALSRYRVFPEAQIKGELAATYRFSPEFTLVAGGDYTRNYAWSQPSAKAQAAEDPDYYTFYITDDFAVVNYTQTFFAEGSLSTTWVDITAGARYDWNSQFGDAFVPRVALSKSLGDFHLKLLASRAFRTPSMLAIYWQNPDLKPEFSESYEAEVGYSLASDMQVTVNVFDLRLDHAITYDGSYENAAGAESRGVEVEWCWQKKWGYLRAAYSYYLSCNNLIEETVPDDGQGDPISGVTLGFPAHKATVNAAFHLQPDLTVDPGLIFFSQRYANYYDALDNLQAETLPPVLLANLFLRQKLLGGAAEIGLGVFNLFNQTYALAPGYFNANQPMPGPSREYVLKLKYHF
jgi:outer membrane receptor protein involved in Fe transport